jgi:CBS domain containing-hemolysin-like protein
MTLGEQAPKMWALRRSESMALDTAFVLRGFTLVFGPLIAVVNAISNSVLRLLGLPQEHGHEASHTAEEIRSVLSLSARAGEISERQYEITENVFRVTELEVRHIVVPRLDVQYLSLEWPLEENLRIVRESGHSRLPLCERGLDSIRGFVHVKDVLDQVLTSGAQADLAALARPGLFVSETMPMPGFLIELQNKRAHCAAVVDEHGTVIGLAFREDALEEIVGPLGDEFDEQTQDFVRIRDGAYELSGRVSLPDVCNELELSLDEDDDEKADTIGGYVVARLGRLPRAGDKVDVGGYRATVLDATRRRVQRLRLEKNPGAAPSEGRG